MKTFKFVLASLAFLVFFTSCKSDSEVFLSDFEAFVTQVEQNAQNYSKEDWNQAEQQLQVFKERREQLESVMTEEQKEQSKELVKRYYTAWAKTTGVGKAIMWLRGNLENVEEVLEGFGFDVCGFLRDLVGVDLCNFLKTTDIPTELEPENVE